MDVMKTLVSAGADLNANTLECDYMYMPALCQIVCCSFPTSTVDDSTTEWPRYINSIQG